MTPPAVWPLEVWLAITAVGFLLGYALSAFLIRQRETARVARVVAPAASPPSKAPPLAKTPESTKAPDLLEWQRTGTSAEVREVDAEHLELRIAETTEKDGVRRLQISTLGINHVMARWLVDELSRRLPKVRNDVGAMTYVTASESRAHPIGADVPHPGRTNPKAVRCRLVTSDGSLIDGELLCGGAGKRYPAAVRNGSRVYGFRTSFDQSGAEVAVYDVACPIMVPAEDDTEFVSENFDVVETGRLSKTAPASSSRTADPFETPASSSETVNEKNDGQKPGSL